MGNIKLRIMKEIVKGFLKTKKKQTEFKPQTEFSMLMSIYDRNVKIVEALKAGEYLLSIKLCKRRSNEELSVPITTARYMELESEMIPLAIDEWKENVISNVKDASKIVLEQLNEIRDKKIVSEKDETLQLIINEIESKTKD